MRFKTLKNRSLNHRGDTIVEVLIAVSIVSFILVTAYATSTRAMGSIREGQERQEALSLAQSQIELLRQNKGIDTDAKGCFDGSQTPAGHGDPGCSFRADGSSSCPQGNVCYYVDTTRDSGGIYTVKISWDGLTGPQNSLSLWYRPPFSAAFSGGGSGAGAGGNAAIGSDPLACAPNCSFAPPPAGRYQFSRRLINLSQNSPANIRSCAWDWGDGTVDNYPGTNQACQFGSYSDNHQYAPPTNLPPYPGACYLQPGSNAYRPVYTVTLTVDLYNGGQRSDSYTFGLPDCV